MGGDVEVDRLVRFAENVVFKPSLQDIKRQVLGQLRALLVLQHVKLLERPQSDFDFWLLSHHDVPELDPLQVFRQLYTPHVVALELVHEGVAHRGVVAS